MQWKAIGSFAWVVALATFLAQCNLGSFSSKGPTRDAQRSAEGADATGASNNDPISVPGAVPMPKDDPLAPMVKSYRIAFIGDQGLNDNTRKVLESIKAAKADLTVILGDYDYEDDANAWDALLTEVLGDSFPIVAAIGNHDTDAWPDYKLKLETRLAKMKDIKCTGDYGVNMSCAFKDVTLVLSGVGTMGSDHEAFIDNTFKAANTPWKVCGWHKNQTAMQAGDKSDEVGWLAYETCRNHGAIVATAHEHSYSRTHLLSNFEMQTIASKEANMVIEPGKSLCFVSGLGGNSVRDQSTSGDYFAKIYTSAQGGTYGMLLCDFAVDNDPRKAHCQFKNINNEVVDDFKLTSKLPVK